MHKHKKKHSLWHEEKNHKESLVPLRLIWRLRPMAIKCLLFRSNFSMTVQPLSRWLYEKHPTPMDNMFFWPPNIFFWPPTFFLTPQHSLLTPQHSFLTPHFFFWPPDFPSAKASSKRGKKVLRRLVFRCQYIPTTTNVEEETKNALPAPPPPRAKAKAKAKTPSPQPATSKPRTRIRTKSAPPAAQAPPTAQAPPETTPATTEAPQPEQTPEKTVVKGVKKTVSKATAPSKAGIQVMREAFTEAHHKEIIDLMTFRTYESMFEEWKKAKKHEKKEKLAQIPHFYKDNFYSKWKKRNRQRL